MPADVVEKHPYRSFKPFEHVREASDHGYYIEAIAMASMWIEVTLIELLRRKIEHGAKKGGLIDPSEMESFMEKFHSMTVSQRLRWALAFEVVDYDLYKRLNGFIKERNHVIHNKDVLKEMSANKLKSLSEDGTKCFRRVFSLLK